jgi:hypothetical protein
VPVSCANEAAVFDKISRSSFNCLFSRRNVLPLTCASVAWPRAARQPAGGPPAFP